MVQRGISERKGAPGLWNRLGAWFSAHPSSLLSLPSPTPHPHPSPPTRPRSAHGPQPSHTPPQAPGLKRRRILEAVQAKPSTSLRSLTGDCPTLRQGIGPVHGGGGRLWVWDQLHQRRVIWWVDLGRGLRRWLWHVGHPHNPERSGWVGSRFNTGMRGPSNDKTGGIRCLQDRETKKELGAGHRNCNQP